VHHDGGRRVGFATAAIRCHAASSKASTPSPVTPEIWKKGSLASSRASRALSRVGIVNRIKLVCRDQLRLRRYLRIEQRKFTLNHVEVFDRLTA
jgi:hypothetical protein